MYIKFSLNFENNYFFRILKKYNYQFADGDILAGKIISFEKYGFILDIGTKILAYLPKSELFFEKKIEALYITRSMQDRADKLTKESVAVEEQLTYHGDRITG